ncbi:MAG: hypothetical protein LBV57_04275 [Candidatus Symbiothrix sp.]|jgi:hypothetical protein|nr:hypothetical protein [Candidatus Symbiothrix sp.]
MMIKRLFFSFLLLVFVCSTGQAQVVIGDLKDPETFSILELVSPAGGMGTGLVHPKMTTIQRTTLTAHLSSTEEAAALGLTIYNTDTGNLEFYQGKGVWLPLGNKAMIPSEIAIDANVSIRAYDPQMDGSLSDGTPGKQRYDIAQTDGDPGGNCGVIGAGRASDFGNFSGNDLKKYYVVEFPNATDYSHLRVAKGQYMVDVVTKIEGEKENTLSTQELISVTFNANLKDIAKGTTEFSALKTTIYAIFVNKDGDFRRAEYEISVMDCLGCGVHLTNQWLPVGCYNLGVIPGTIAPDDPDSGNGSALYQWGRISDGHETATKTYQPFVALGEITFPTAPLDSLTVHGQPSGQRAGQLILSSAESVQYFGADWSTQHHSALWGDGSQNLHAGKSVNDPCPLGFKIPALQEMEQIALQMELNPAKTGWVNKNAGDRLFIPFTSYISQNGIVNEQSQDNSFYWTATNDASATHNDAARIFAYSKQSSNTAAGSIAKACAIPVRCIGELTINK